MCNTDKKNILSTQSKRPFPFGGLGVRHARRRDGSPVRRIASCIRWGSCSACSPPLSHQLSQSPWNGSLSGANSHTSSPVGPAAVTVPPPKPPESSPPSPQAVRPPARPTAQQPARPRPAAPGPSPPLQPPLQGWPSALNSFATGRTGSVGAVCTPASRFVL